MRRAVKYGREKEEKHDAMFILLLIEIVSVCWNKKERKMGYIRTRKKGSKEIRSAVENATRGIPAAPLASYTHTQISPPRSQDIRRQRRARRRACSSVVARDRCVRLIVWFSVCLSAEENCREQACCGGLVCRRRKGRGDDEERSNWFKCVSSRHYAHVAKLIRSSSSSKFLCGLVPGARPITKEAKGRNKGVLLVSRWLVFRGNFIIITHTWVLCVCEERCTPKTSTTRKSWEPNSSRRWDRSCCWCSPSATWQVRIEEMFCLFFFLFLERGGWWKLEGTDRVWERERELNRVNMVCVYWWTGWRRRGDNDIRSVVGYIYSRR